MPSALRSRLTYANVVATLALVFAMSGGALAATHYLITSTKQISPKVLKKLEGREGAAGAAGKEGAAGKAGGNGANGSNGSDGEGVSVSEVKPGETTCSRLGGAKFAVGGKEAIACNGKAGTNGLEGEKGESVTASEVQAGETACKELGGSKFQVGSHGQETFACNGKEGSPWTDKGKLPPGATETGTWSFVENTSLSPEERVHLQRVPISFPISLAAPLPAIDCSFGVEEEECHVEVVGEGQTGTGNCDGGTAEDPTAKPGYLCIYVNRFEEGATPKFHYEDPGNEAKAEVGPTGVFLVLQTAGEHGGEGRGTWAVTAEG
jgi:hypothetical protein